MYVLNDLHMGVSRSAGTTPSSQAALAAWQLHQLHELLQQSFHSDLLINGDLFDKFDVENGVLLDTLLAFSEWLKASSHKLFLVPGNHDLSKDSSKVSAIALMFRALEETHGTRVEFVNSARMVADGVYVIPHVPNQDLFDLELELVPADAKFVLLHCNYDNNFAEQSDHSLNLTPAQAEKLPGFVVIAHEHQQRYALDQRVIIVGNQIPTSIADCLGPAYKFVARLDPATQGVHLDPWLPISNVFEQIDWRDLGTHEGPQLFIRVTGAAGAQEAAEVVTAIAKYRARSPAFVVSNAVEVEGATIVNGVAESIEAARSFDAVGAILSMLDDRERAVVQRLYREAE